MKAYIVSLGCPKNLTDTEVIMGKLVSAGHEITTKEKDADIYIVNTCAFLKSARQEAINTIKRLQKTGKPVYTAGCLPKYLKNMPNEMRHKLLGFRISDFGFNPIDSIGLFSYKIPRIKATPPWTAYVKIAEGCDNRCSYCLIPSIRGRLRIREKEDILNEVRLLAKRGVKEIIFVSQDTTAHPQLAQILRQTAKIDGIHWIRIMYAHPEHLTDKIIKVIKTEPKIVKYIDLPIQHINDKILRLMNRPGMPGLAIKKLISKLRREIPGIAVRTSLIVGFPQETDSDFEELLNFIKEVKLERLGVFRYSREEGTPASIMRGQVPEKIKSYRFHKLMSLQNKISRELNKKMIGKIIEILYEGRGRGRAAFDAPEIDGSVIISPPKAGKNLIPGEFARLKVANSRDYVLTGSILTT